MCVRAFPEEHQRSLKYVYWPSQREFILHINCYAWLLGLTCYYHPTCPHVPNHLCFRLFTFAVCSSVGWWTVFAFAVLSLTESVSFVRQVQVLRGASVSELQCPWTCSHTRGCITTRPRPASPPEGKTALAVSDLQRRHLTLFKKHFYIQLKIFSLLCH